MAIFLSSSMAVFQRIRIQFINVVQERLLMEWEICSLSLLKSVFYPTAIKGCRGIVFTHGVRMGGRAGGRWDEVCQACISETVRCRKLIQSNLIISNFMGPFQ